MEFIDKEVLLQETTFLRDEDGKLIGAVKITDIYRLPTIDVNKALQELEDKIYTERKAYRRKQRDKQAHEVFCKVFGILEQIKAKVGE